MRYPRNLKKGDYIGVTAPSAGITNQVKLLRLDNIKNNFEKIGYKYLETENVRTDNQGDKAVEIYYNSCYITRIINRGGNYNATKSKDYKRYGH